MDQAQQFELCLKELDFIQEAIARYDGNGLTVKSWCLTLGSALAAYAVVHRSAFIAVVAAVATLAFGAIELIYRCFQYRFIRRSGELEKCLEKFDLNQYKYGLHACATNRCWREEISVALRQPHFVMFYLMLFALSLLLGVGLSFNWIPVLPKP
jgi:hypothetical protein